MSRGFIVGPRSGQQIKELAHSVLDALKIQGAYVPILQIVENAIAVADDQYDFRVIEPADMERLYGPGVEGITDHRQNTIALRSDVYARAADGSGRDRFTAAHELGHYLLHQTEGRAFLRASHPGLKSYMDSEWQANTFARELLADIRFIETDDRPELIARRFGVSMSVAEIQASTAKKMARIKGPY